MSVQILVRWRCWIFVWAALLSMSGCMTTQGVAIKEIQHPLSVVKNVVTSYLPGGVRKTSANGRELWSEYFDPETLKESSSENQERAYVHALVLGSRRPYTIEVRAYKERKTKKGYVNMGRDDQIARDVARRIQTDLANRREDRSIIDDFRAF